MASCAYARQPRTSLTESITRSHRGEGQEPMTKYLTPFVALAGLFLSPMAQAQPACNVGSLQGDYAFMAQGEVLGTLDAAGAVHPFPAPSPINAVAVVTFYGNGTLDRVVFTMNNGAPQVAQPPNIR